MSGKKSWTQVQDAESWISSHKKISVSTSPAVLNDYNVKPNRSETLSQHSSLMNDFTYQKHRGD